MSKRSGMNTPEKSCNDTPKFARVSDGARTSNDPQLVSDVAQTVTTTALARLDSWHGSLNGYIMNVKSLFKSGKYTGDPKKTLGEALVELYWISGCLCEVEEIIVKTYKKDIATSGFEVAMRSEDFGEKWDLLEIFWDRLKTGEDWIDFQKTGRNMRLEFMNSAHRLMKVLSEFKQGQSRPTSAKVKSSGRSHNPSRIDRWSRLNEVLKLAGKQTKNESTPFSSISWDHVSCIFSTTSYEQPQKDIGTERLKFLREYLVFVTKCLAKKGSEAPRIHLIAPILFCVGSLLEDVQIVIERELKGEFIQAHGRFEFIIKRGNKMICILEAKEEKIEKGIAQDLVGCALAAEGDGSEVVYGIVTNYVEWVFLRITSEEIFEDHFSIATNSHGPQMEALKIVADKLYAILSDEDARKD